MEHFPNILTGSHEPTEERFHKNFAKGRLNKNVIGYAFKIRFGHKHHTGFLKNILYAIPAKYNHILDTFERIDFFLKINYLMSI